jgi:predicted O-linked N-acetylglucosamine transferase (SPINDLY family)
VQHHQAGRLTEAEQLYRQVLALQPDHVGALHYLAATAHQHGQNDVALDLIRQVLALRPDYPDAHGLLGLVFRAQGQLREAAAEQRTAIALDPNYAEAYSNLGNALRDNGQFHEAIAACRQAIALRPSFAEAYINLGNALRSMGQLDEAVVAYRQAIALNPDFHEAHNNLGNALADMGRLDEALAAYRRAVSLAPGCASTDSNLIYTLHFHPAYDGRAIADELRRWNRQHAEPLRESFRSHPNDRNPDRPLRIGYVSPDFCHHVVGRNLLPLFLQHDRRQFQITCYSNAPRPDALTSQLRQNVDSWRDIIGLSDEQAARQIRADRIDILVDLTLHMANNRLLVFARKPAPVQVTYLAYCASSGMSAMDYRFSDPYLDPPDTDLSCYSEKTIRLESTYWCYQPSPAPSPLAAPMLSNGFATFGCLNNFAKVSPAALDLWAGILAATPRSRIIIHASPGAHVEDAARRMEQAGVAQSRLRFVGKQTWTAYLQTYRQIDIALDPFPYGGGITTCDALWMGVPVVSLSGETAVGRGGRSILSNLGLQELIALSQEQYRQIAIDLARNVDRIELLRQGMRARMLASPLMDAPKFARSIEAAYRQMWRTWCA